MERKVKETAGSQTTPAGDSKEWINGFVSQLTSQLDQATPDCEVESLDCCFRNADG